MLCSLSVGQRAQDCLSCGEVLSFSVMFSWHQKSDMYLFPHLSVSSPGFQVVGRCASVCCGVNMPEDLLLGLLKKQGLSALLSAKLPFLFSLPRMHISLHVLGVSSALFIEQQVPGKL